MTFRNIIAALITGIWALVPLCAEEPAVAPVEVLPPSLSYASFEQQVGEQWQGAISLIEGGKFGLAGDKLTAVNNLKLQSGFESIEELSLYLIEKSAALTEAGHLETATFLLRKAFEISPRSPQILLKSLWLSRKLGVNSVVSQLNQALGASWYSPLVALKSLEGLTYPILWALTLAVFFGVIMHFSFRIHFLLRGAVRYWPIGLRTLLGPGLVLFLLVAPLPFGPLWCLFGWGIAAFWFLPQRSLVNFSCGTVLILWAATVPIHENLAFWLQEPRVKVMMSSLANDYGRLAKGYIHSLALERPGDAVPFFALGVEKLRREELEAADQAFDLAAGILGRQPWTDAAKASVALSKGRVEQAERLFQDAEEQGMSNAEFYFNYSRLRFEQMKVAESRELFKKSQGLNQALAAELSQREGKVQSHDPRGLASIKLPLSMLFNASQLPVKGAKESTDLLIQSIMPGTNPISMGLVGVFLMVLALIPRIHGSRKKGQLFFADYRRSAILLRFLRLVPGGSWILAGRPVPGVLLLSLLMLLTMPVLGWPVWSSVVAVYSSNFWSVYTTLVALAAVAVVALGHYLPEAK